MTHGPAFASFAPARICLPASLHLPHQFQCGVADRPARPARCHAPRMAVTPDDMSGGDAPASDASAPNGTCPYCSDEKMVDCPACEGRGYHGRTIACYYCRGKKRIECPLCIDDIYKLSYVKRSESFDDASEPDSSSA